MLPFDADPGNRRDPQISSQSLENPEKALVNEATLQEYDRLVETVTERLAVLGILKDGELPNGEVFHPQTHIVRPDTELSSDAWDIFEANTIPVVIITPYAMRENDNYAGHLEVRTRRMGGGRWKPGDESEVVLGVGGVVYGMYEPVVLPPHLPGNIPVTFSTIDSLGSGGVRTSPFSSFEVGPTGKEDEIGVLGVYADEHGTTLFPVGRFSETAFTEMFDIDGILMDDPREEQQGETEEIDDPEEGIDPNILGQAGYDLISGGLRRMVPEEKDEERRQVGKITGVSGGVMQIDFSDDTDAPGAFPAEMGFDVGMVWGSLTRGEDNTDEEAYPAEDDAEYRLALTKGAMEYAARHRADEPEDPRPVFELDADTAMELEDEFGERRETDESDTFIEADAYAGPYGRGEQPPSQRRYAPSDLQKGRVVYSPYDDDAEGLYREFGGRRQKMDPRRGEGNMTEVWRPAGEETKITSEAPQSAKVQQPATPDTKRTQEDKPAGTMSWQERQQLVQRAKQRRKQGKADAKQQRIQDRKRRGY